jgi:archaetidylinositol phosphate synthase
MISDLRKHIKPLQELIALPFIKLKINPNHISFLGLIFAMIGAYFVYNANWLLALIFFLLAPLMDLIDGTVARKTKSSSNWGNYFETMIDKFVDVLIYGSFIFYYPLACMLAISLSLISSYAKPRVGLIIVTDNRDWPAIGEHGDKLAIIFTSLILAILGFNYFELALYLIALISLIGTIQRMIYAKKLIKEAEKKGNLLPYIKKKKER